LHADHFGFCKPCYKGCRLTSGSLNIFWLFSPWSACRAYSPVDNLHAIAVLNVDYCFDTFDILWWKKKDLFLIKIFNNSIFKALRQQRIFAVSPTKLLCILIDDIYPVVNRSPGQKKDFIAWLKSLSNPNYKNRYLADVHCKTRVMNSIGLRIIKQPTFQMTGKHYPLNSSRPETSIKITKQLLHFHLVVVNIRQLLFVPCFTFTIPVWNIRHRCKVRILTNERGGGEALYFSRRHSWKTICLIIALHSRSKMAWSKCFWKTLNAENHTNLLRH